MDKSRGRTFVYHETEAPKGKQVYSEDAAELLEQDGWVDTPAKFGEKEEKPEVDVEDIEVDIEDEEEEIPDDDASDLSDYLNDKYGLKTNYRVGLKKLKIILKENQ